MSLSVPGLRPLAKALYGQWDFKMDSKLRATKDRIIVIPEAPVTQEGRFYVSNLLPSNQGRVVSVGPESTDVEVGSRISFKPFSGHDLEYDGTKYRVIEREDVLLLLDV